MSPGQNYLPVLWMSNACADSANCLMLRPRQMQSQRFKLTGGDTAKAGGTRGRAPTNEYTSVSRCVRDGRYTRQEDLSCITNT